MRKGFTLIEVLVVVIVAPFMLIVLNDLFKTLIKDVPRSYQVVQENASLDRYDFEASYSSNTMTIYSWIGGAYNEIIPGGKPERTAKPDGDTHVYRVEVSGNSIKAYVDDELHFEFEDDSFEAGRIGLGGYGSTVQFDNLKITGTGIKAVDPALKLSAAWGEVKRGI